VAATVLLSFDETGATAGRGSGHGTTVDRMVAQVLTGIDSITVAAGVMNGDGDNRRTRIGPALPPCRFDLVFGVTADRAAAACGGIVMAREVTILGFGAAVDAAALLTALQAIEGPKVLAVTAYGVVALAQHGGGPAVARGRGALLRGLHCIQRRLQAACQMAAFLPADPAQCGCRDDDLAVMLPEAADAIAAALDGPGRCHQWDVVLRWSPEAVAMSRRAEIAAEAGEGAGELAEAVAAALARERDRRASSLLAALRPVVLAMAPAEGGAAEAGVTVLVPAGSDATLERALRGLPDAITEGATADLRGPMPPLSFAAVRLASAATAELARAWRLLDLPDQIDDAALRRQWRRAAAPSAEAGSAFRLLRGLLPAASGHAWTLSALQQRGLRRLVAPASPHLDHYSLGRLQ
jgi:hypothetical protein